MSSEVELNLYLFWKNWGQIVELKILNMNIRTLKEDAARSFMFILSMFVLSMIFFIAVGLYWKAKPILDAHSLKELLFSSRWHPTQGQFGLAGFIMGTIWVTAIATAIAVPLSLLTATYLSEYCPRPMRGIVKPVIDLLAGISPVIYGVCGMIVVVPFVRDRLMPFFSERLPFFPFLSDNYTGFSALTAGIVLAVMISPLIISVIEEVMKTVPLEVREASLALGATAWQTTKNVVLRKVRPAIVAAVILGLSRAMGETMAVLMIAGCAMQGFPRSIFDTAYPLPALIANTYGEMMSVPLYDAAILLAAFILLGITVFFNMAAWGTLLYLQRREL